MSAFLRQPAIHVHASDEEILNRLDGQVVSPLRDPWSVYVSYYSRKGTGHGTKVTMEHAWERLAYWNDRLDIFYIPVDKPLDFFGVTLPREGHFPSKEPPYKDLTWIYELPMVKPFYEAKSANS